MSVEKEPVAFGCGLPVNAGDAVFQPVEAPVAVVVGVEDVPIVVGGVAGVRTEVGPLLEWDDEAVVDAVLLARLWCP